METVPVVIGTPLKRAGVDSNIAGNKEWYAQVGHDELLTIYFLYQLPLRFITWQSWNALAGAMQHALAGTHEVNNSFFLAWR